MDWTALLQFVMKHELANLRYMYMAIVTSLCRLLTKNHQLTLATLSLAKATVLLIPGHPTYGCVEHYMLYPFIYNNTCYNIHGAMMIKFWQDV